MSGPERPRFPREAATHEDALTYYRNRATQLLCTDWVREGDPERLPWGVHVRLRRGDDVFHSLFVLRDHTGRGHLTRWRADHPDARFVVMDACAAVTTWLDHKQVPFVVAEPFLGVEYEAIEQFYGDRVAKRSGAWLMPSCWRSSTASSRTGTCRPTASPRQARSRCRRCPRCSTCSWPTRCKTARTSSATTRPPTPTERG